MTAMNTSQTAGPVTEPTIADSLREVADWLEAHPEIHPRWGFVPIDATNRADLEQLAEALGDRATETLTFGNSDVQIAGHFGPSRVYATVPISKLAGAPVVPEYEPILAGRDGR